MPQAQGVTIEAVFFASTDPAATSRFYADALGLGTATVTEDGQYTFDNAGVFFAVEPLVPSDDGVGGVDSVGGVGGVDSVGGVGGVHSVDGQVTVWFRTGDVAAVAAHLVGHGAIVIDAPSSAGDEIVATLRAPGGHRIGLIGPA